MDTNHDPVVQYFYTQGHITDRRRFHATGPCHFAMILENVGKTYQGILSRASLRYFIEQIGRVPSCAICGEPFILPTKTSSQP